MYLYGIGATLYLNLLTLVNMYSITERGQLFFGTRYKYYDTTDHSASVSENLFNRQLHVDDVGKLVNCSSATAK
jgi:hypothetical protein